MKYIFSLLIVFLCLSVKAQQAEYVDFKTCKAVIYLDSEKNEVFGFAEYKFDILKSIKNIQLDAKNTVFDYLSVNEIEYLNINNDLNGNISGDFKPSSDNVLQVKYRVNPKKALYFVEKDNDFQIWTQGQGKYTSNWLPSIDDVNDKIEFDLSITFENDYEVIANGKLVNKDVGEKTTKWSYDMKQPMSSYLLAIAIGKYNKKVEHSKSGIPLEMYYYPEDSLKVEPTYRYTKQMFDFLEEEIGVAYPWQNYKQVPVHDFLYAGMENTSCTIFSDAFMIDETAFVDKNYVNVNAHELAHQWFGNLVTAKSGEHHWLQEGFATYYALLAEKEVFGDDYYNWKLYEYAQELLEQDKAGNSTSVLNPKSSSITFYKKGAWVLLMLREKVGDKAFKNAVKKYLEEHQFGNVETDDFIGEVEKASGENLDDFKAKWLVSKELPYDDMEEFLYLTSIIMKTYFLIDATTVNGKKKILSKKSHYRHQIKAIKLLGGNLPLDVFDIKNIKVRQAIAQNLTEIPSELREDYESLLNDKSYITIESALYNLWNNFPEYRAKYLSQTKDVIGFNTKNVRLLWLVLALNTPGYQPEQSQNFYNELLDYTSPKYNFKLRQDAFQYLLMLKSCKTECQQNLEQATTHHNWRLSKFAKEQLKHINTN